MPRLNLFSVELCQEDVRDGMQHIFRGARQKVGNAYKNPAVAQANRVVDSGEGKKFDVEFGEGRAWTNLAVCLEKDFVKSWSHLDRI